ncbi:MAG: LuxR C-terminal-related transcriptional regulator [Deinococcales bacterium]
MTNAILSTKLRQPPVRADQAPRPRLRERFERGTDGRLTLVSAPAGYGKTTALASWAAHTGKPVAWLSLDEADNAPQRFLRHLVAALQRRDETLRELGDFVGEDLEAALITVVNDVADNPEPLVLVLDDVHVIHAERVHDLVRFLLDHAPEQLRLVLATRADPPLPLARLRVARALTEVRVDELRFTAAEAVSMLAAQGLHLAREDVEELTLRTEGWPAGLHLAALSLRGQSDPHAFIGFFTGTDRFVLEYLTEEVLMRQPANVQDFLLLTSVLDELDAGLAGAVTREDDAQAMLEHIERHNLFLVPLDAQRQRFRYHAFFQDLLQHRLRAARPDLLAELHRRASEALETRGEHEEALLQALLSGDDDRVARLLERHPRRDELQRALGAIEEGHAGPTTAARDDRPDPAAVRAALREALDGSGVEEAAGAPRGPGSYGDEPLSEREVDVLRLIAAGLANKQIARRLDVSTNTVKTHVRRLYGKLSVHSRLQVVERGRELGLL